MEEALRLLLVAALPGVPVAWGLGSDALPRVVMFVVSGADDYTQDGPTGLAWRRVQADCYGATYGAAKTLSRNVIAALSGHRGGIFNGIFLDAVRDGEPTDEPDSVQARVSLDFMVHYRS